ncbi:hypothetical protein BDZ89DRAFT_1132654 [Hymenopellis radicata]|nr:hypothetical protein BDZ89DRAFT_1144635 [Hymenopellis radicata]KAF9030007.1 hypothetical protein BDZ89DRAFT_1132654 [Hymenopellis radicata]
MLIFSADFDGRPLEDLNFDDNDHVYSDVLTRLFIPVPDVARAAGLAPRCVLLHFSFRWLTLRQISNISPTTWSRHPPRRHLSTRLQLALTSGALEYPDFDLNDSTLSFRLPGLNAVAAIPPSDSRRLFYVASTYSLTRRVFQCGHPGMGLLTWLRAGEWQFGFVPAERRSLVLLRQEVIKRDFCPKDITWLRLSLDPRYGNLQHSSTMFIEDVNADDHPCSRTDEEGEGVFPEWESNNL